MSDRPLSTPLERLREWSDDALHLTQSVRMHEPVYANPAEIRRDVRVLIEIAEDAIGLLDHHISEEQRRELGHRIIERLQ